ncbi:hypothetical protein ACFP3Q_00295 [Nocardioides sp. GCM10027113]|uniref:hypothetical protein n=1 Tax=unclassified Nocardioides TaxID=2615069 RepID=UPI00360E82DA
MPLLLDPVDRNLASELRRAVLQWRTGSSSRHPAARLHLGRPGGTVLSWAEPPGAGPVDRGLRCDVIARMLDHGVAGADPLVWLGRAGELEWEDPDAAWLSAALVSFGEAGRPLTMVVVTREGWWDPRSGTRRTWRRLRDRSCG